MFNFTDGNMTVFIGNFISLLACIVMVLIGFIRSKNNILLAQCVQFLLMGASNFVLGGTGSVIANMISLVRNVVFTKVKPNRMLKIAFIVVQAVLTIPALSLNPISWVPLVSVGVFTWFIDLEDVVKFKIVIMATVVLWIAYDLAHYNYVLAASDAFAFLSTGYSIYKIKKLRAAEETADSAEE